MLRLYSNCIPVVVEVGIHLPFFSKEFPLNGKSFLFISKPAEKSLLSDGGIEGSGNSQFGVMNWGIMECGMESAELRN
jgi:hypothetical protein